MKKSKRYFSLLVSFAILAGLAGCSTDNKDTIIPPVDPPTSVGIVPLTQFEVLLNGQKTSGSANRSDIEVFNNPKMEFLATDQFTFSYGNATQASQKAYAYTPDASTWTVHENEDPNSPVKIIQLDAKSPVLTAAYLSKAATAKGADIDGIIAGKDIDGKEQVNCFDALLATAEVTVSNSKATAKVPFKHVNHLLNIHVQGTINENAVDHLSLTVSYKDAAGTPKEATLKTSSRADYADTQGTRHTVFQAIVPRNAEVTGIQVEKINKDLITTSEAIRIDCPGGKSHLLTLNVNEQTMTVQVGAMIDEWAYGGEMNTDGSPVGNVYIATADDLRIFSGAVAIDPGMPGARFQDAVAYTAHVVQTKDIDLSDLEFRPIGGSIYTDKEGGSYVSHFAGTYNGNGFKITGMRVTSSKASGVGSLTSYAGMFGNVQSPAEGHAILTNIQLVDVDINIDKPVDQSHGGALAAYAYAKRGKEFIIISECSVQGKIRITNTSGKVFAGGLVGEANKAQITGSSSDVSVTTEATDYSYAGGLVGCLLDSYIASSYAKNSVSGKSTVGTSSAGGIIGELNESNGFSKAFACSSEGNVSSHGAKETNAGGVAGYNSGNVIGCYARGNVTATGNGIKSGAILGSGYSSETNLCYGVGSVGAGTSSLAAKNLSIVYKTNPAAGEILSIVSGSAWNAKNSEMAEATLTVLTTLSITTGSNSVLEVKARLWSLSDAKVWSSGSPASQIYPLPDITYKGQ